MKNLIFTLLFLSFSISVFAQIEPKIGDILVIKAQKGAEYNHIDLPKLNILIKRGKVGNYKSVYGTTVIVDDVMSKDGKTYVTLKQKDGSKFLGLKSEVKANYTAAIEAGELVVRNSY